MTPRMQALLLCFLESGEVRPVGSDTLHVASTRESSQPPIAISTHDRSWNLSRRFALPNPRCASACAAAARARGGYPAAADALHRADRSESEAAAGRVRSSLVL